MTEMTNTKSDSQTVICPDCGAGLTEVRWTPDSYLNQDQFDSAKLGDYYCVECADNSTKTGYRYFKASEVLPEQTKETEMTNTKEDVEAIRERLTAAEEMVSRLCHGERRWTMSIPAQPTNDPDLIISASLHDVDSLLARVAELEQEVEYEIGMKEQFKGLAAKQVEMFETACSEHEQLTQRAEAAEAIIQSADALNQAYDLYANEYIDKGERKSRREMLLNEMSDFYSSTNVLIAEIKEK